MCLHRARVQDVSGAHPDGERQARAGDGVRVHGDPAGGRAPAGGQAEVLRVSAAELERVPRQHLRGERVRGDERVAEPCGAGCGCGCVV